jgi:hypothetical protein
VLSRLGGRHAARGARQQANAHGDVTLVHLPEIGIHGSTHFLMPDLNNGEVADVLSRYLAEKKLD